MTVRKPSNGYEIRQVIQEGRGPQVLSVGDRWPVKMKGRVGILDIDATYYVALIGLDHNKSVETYGRPNAHFKFPYDANGKQLAFVDSRYADDTTGVEVFCINISGGNAGGWKDSFALNTLSFQFWHILEPLWQDAIGECIKYTDNVANGSGIVAKNVTATTQRLFYLGYYEAFAEDYVYVNTYEKDYQVQYSFYVNGNSRIHYRHNNTNSTAMVFLRSCSPAHGNDFRIINDLGGTTGGAYGINCTASLGAAPAFTIF